MNPVLYLYLYQIITDYIPGVFLGGSHGVAHQLGNQPYPVHHVHSTVHLLGENIRRRQVPGDQILHEQKMLS